MKVGDLIKVYDFTQRARNKFKSRARVDDDYVDAHFVGLIVGGDYTRQYRLVLQPDGETEFYNLDRMEIINESR